MVAFLKTSGPSRSLQALNERLGLASFEMISTDNAISTDPTTPTIFTYEHTIILPAGEEILDLNTWNSIRLPMNISCHVISQAQGIMDRNCFFGRFATRMDYLEARTQVNMNGSFEVNFA